jgi:hypothetical protein
VESQPGNFHVDLGFSLRSNGLEMQQSEIRHFCCRIEADRTLRASQLVRSLVCNNATTAICFFTVCFRYTVVKGTVACFFGITALRVILTLKLQGDIEQEARYLVGARICFATKSHELESTTVCLAFVH